MGEHQTRLRAQFPLPEEAIAYAIELDEVLDLLHTEQPTALHRQRAELVFAAYPAPTQEAALGIQAVRRARGLGTETGCDLSRLPPVRPKDTPAGTVLSLLPLLRITHDEQEQAQPGLVGDILHATLQQFALPHVLAVEFGGGALAVSKDDVLVIEPQAQASPAEKKVLVP